MATTSYEVKRVLSDYLFRTFWNEAQESTRRFHALACVSNGSVIGVNDFGCGQISLPETTKRYYVYAMAAATIGSAILDSLTTDWTSLTSLMAENDAEYRVYTEHGITLFRPSIFCRVYNHRQQVLFAVERAMFLQLADQSETARLVFETYYDTDGTADITVQSFHPANAADVAEATAAAATADRVVVNGYWYAPDVEFNIGDYIELLEDGNLVGEFELTSFSELGYTDANDVVRLLVHVPKAFNPDRRMITLNCVDFIFQTPAGGVLFNQGTTAGSVAVKQLTHADFALPMAAVDEYRTMYGATSLLVRVRRHASDNTMPRDASYCDVLYRHGDADIVSFLLGHSSPMTFWTAASLQDGAYSSFMLEPIWFPDRVTVDHYVQGLGYYHAMSLIYPQVQYFTAEIGQTSYTITFPATMWAHLAATIADAATGFIYHTFRNGIRLPDDAMSVAATSAEDATVELTLAAGYAAAVEAGDKIIVELHEQTTAHSYRLAPVDTTPLVIGMPLAEAMVFKVVDTPNDTVVGVAWTLSEAYLPTTFEELDAEVEEIDATSFSVIIPAAHYGNEFVVQPNRGLVKFNVPDDTISDSIISLTPMVSVFTPTEPEVAAGAVPVLGEGSFLVYQNSRALARDVDFKVIELAVGPASKPSGYQVVVQGIEFLEASSNDVTVFFKRGVEIAAEHGHPVPGNPTGLDMLFLWFPTLSIAFSDGKLLFDGDVDFSEFTATMQDNAYGAVSASRTSIPTTADVLLPSARKLEDLDRIDQIRRYLAGLAAELGYTAVAIVKTHDVYSTYLSALAHTLISTNAALAADDDPDPELVTQVATAAIAYARIREYDLVFSGNLDPKFIDFFPSWRRLDITNKATYDRLQALCQDLAGLDRDTDRTLFR